MAIYTNTSFRIKRSAEQEEMMKKLSSTKVFSSYKDILMISAIIGYNEGKYSPIAKTASDGVLMQFFQPRDLDIIDLIAYGHEKSQASLKLDVKYDIFSSYANGGFPILLKKLGVDENTEFNDITIRDMAEKYYRLLLSSGFLSKEDNSIGTANELFL